MENLGGIYVEDVYVRLTNIIIEHFKNVSYGQLNFINNRKNFKTSILGLYGQNGSGKTVLIDAIQLLKYALCGQSIPAHFADYIQIESSNAKIQYTFSVQSKGHKYEAYYEFKIRKDLDTTFQNTTTDDFMEEHYKVTLFDEVLGYSYADSNGENKTRKEKLIDTTTPEVFVPIAKYKCLLGNDKEVNTDLLVIKKLTAASSRSFIFSSELINKIRERRSIIIDGDFGRHLSLLESLISYGNFELFIINTKNSGMISMNALPLAFKYEKKNHNAVGNMMIPLEAPTIIPKNAVEVVKKVISDMNIVLSQIIPGLTISVKELGIHTLKSGKLGSRIQLMSCKNKKQIPLKYESKGIKKIVSILHLLIVIYNQFSITVAIDEIDAGVFEYLLGELLKILSEKGKGQLIFTSHNLRPLETLDRGFVAFTTTNPDNRYIRMSGIKDNNNLRDFYFRDIMLGEQDEKLYHATNNAEIALAFREAGEIDVS